MLTKPDCGWSDFNLDGTSVYPLSYLDNIPFNSASRLIKKKTTSIQNYVCLYRIFTAV